MNNEKKNICNYNELEIDLIDVFWRLLAQWKAILLFSIIMAVAVCLLGYKLDQKKYTQAVKEESQNEKEALSPSEEKFLMNEYSEGVAEIMEALDEADRSAVLNLLRQEKTLNDQRTYFNDSIYMNLDSNHLRRLSMGYMISCKDGRDDKYVDMLIKEYRNINQDERLLNAIKSEMGLDVDLRFIKELIGVDSDVTISSADKGGTDSFYINVWIPDEKMDTTGIQEAIEERVQSYQEQLTKSVSEFSIKLIQRKEYITADSGMLVAQTDMLNRINSMAYNVKTNKDGLQGNQAKAYEMITDQDLSASSDAIQSYQQELNGISRPHYSVKYLILGFMCGIILYVIIFIIWFILNGINYSSRTLPAMTNSRILGSVHMPRENKKSHLLLESTLVKKLKDAVMGDVNSQISNVVNEVAAVCRYNGISEFAFIECGTIGENAKKSIHSISKELSSRGIKNKNISIIDLQMNDDVKINNVILGVEKDITKIKEIRRNVEELTICNIDIVGALYFE